MRLKLPLIGLIIAAALVAGGSVVVIRAMSGQSGTGDTARLVPDDVALYATVNTDASSRQWLQLAALMQRLGLDKQARSGRNDGLTQAGLDWDKDVAPYLGGEATLAITSLDGSQPGGLAVLSVTDGDKAWQHATSKLDELAQESGAPGSDSSYRGLTIRTYPAAGAGSPLAVTHQGRYLMLASSTDLAQTVLDLNGGKGKALASTKGYRDARAAVSADPLAFVYLNLARLGDLAASLAPAQAGSQSTQDLLQSAGLDKAAEAFAFSSESDGVRFEFQTVDIDPAKSAVTLRAAPADSHLAHQAPADALFFFAGNDLYDSYIKGIRRALQQYGSSPDAAGSVAQFNDTLNQLSQQLGFDAEKDLLAHLTGEYGFALGASGASTNGLWALAGAIADDPAAVQQALDKIADFAAQQGTPATTISVAGARLYQIANPDNPDENAAVTVAGDELLAGFGNGVLQGALAPAHALADDADFRDALTQLPKDRALTWYVNVKRIVALAQQAAGGDGGGDVPWQALGKLRYAVGSVSQAKDHAGGVLLIRLGP
ncbi:MAG TPA: DUF3352 domain-containing protein [Dehalococcoidia bacterium]|nr:DUF3352 domain-containing protein [Dehalococcoidia bacterium]